MPKRKRSDSDSAENATSPKRSKVMSPLEALPTEILQKVVLDLKPEDQFTIQVVSKRLQSVTKKSDGSRLIPLPPWTPWSWTKKNTYTKTQLMRKRYGKAMARVEACMPDTIKLGRQTCSGCGYRLGLVKTCKGFSDDQFDRHLAPRYCINCMAVKGWLGSTTFTVAGQGFFRCNRCRCFRSPNCKATLEDICKVLAPAPVRALAKMHGIKSGPAGAICVRCCSNVVESDWTRLMNSAPSTSGDDWKLVAIKAEDTSS